MAKNKGIFQFAANFQVKVAEALDPRMVAASKADLINKDNWPSDGDTIYVYKGLIVDCGNDGVYRLIDPTKALASDYSGWQRIDAGGVKIDNIFTYKGNIESYDLLPSDSANIGDVYNVESDFTIVESTPLGDETSKHYYAGTNVAWNGTSWDPLTGSVDLSSYASKEEVSTLRTTISSNTEGINNLNSQLVITNQELSNKVDIIEGSSLITNEKLLLIDSNSEQIVTLRSDISELNSKVTNIENSVVNEFETLKLTVNNQGVKLQTLETDNSNNKLNITNLQTQSESNTARLGLLSTAIEQKQTQIDNLTLRVSGVETSISSFSAGSGLSMNGKTFSVKIDPSSDNALSVSDNGLLVSLSKDISTTVENIVDRKVEESLEWDVII